MAKMSALDWMIERWHQGEGEDLSLHEWLGWSLEEYQAWVRDPDCVPDRPLGADT